MVGIILVVVIVAVIAYLLNNSQGYKRNTQKRRNTYYPPRRKSLYVNETAEKKGYRGEYYVRQVIGDTVPGEKYVINDFMFRHGGKTAQIDHILINKNGVYVIETKNYSGTVYGNDRQNEWTQFVGSKKHTVYNPVKQNSAHIGYLQERLGGVYLNSLVVLVQGNTEHINSDFVIPLSALKMKLDMPSKIKPYTPEQMGSIYSKLREIQQVDNVTQAEHVINVSRVTQTVRCGICPRCGRTLVTRKGKYGDFLGCSGYPECDFIKKGR